MFRVRLVLRHEGDNRLVYGVSTGFRLIFLTIAAVVLFSLLAIPIGPLLSPPNAVPLAFLLICSAAALYNERWVFDRAHHSVEHHLGLLGLYRRRSFGLETLRRIEISGFRMGHIGGGESRRAFTRSYVSISLIDADGEVRKIDIAKTSHLAEIRRTARSISEFCDIPLDDGVQEAG